MGVVSLTGNDFGSANQTTRSDWEDSGRNTDAQPEWLGGPECEAPSRAHYGNEGLRNGLPESGGTGLSG
jgi:hypothetical protein